MQNLYILTLLANLGLFVVSGEAKLILSDLG